MNRPFVIRLIALALGFCLSTEAARAQYLTRPGIKWETIETRHFAVHFPAEMRRWTTEVAARLESYAEAVTAMVGNAPTARVTVMVEDPSSVSNGFALPFLEGPVIFLWPTPPMPSPSFGSHRGWGEILAVHEYGHIAHLTFPSRNPRERLLWRLAPTQLSPVARKAPAWVVEGYATLIEGRLTGSGRPTSVGRAAVLREWALEGRLPTYAQLNGTGSFLGGAMRYLAGSAFLEWLEAQKGDSSLVHLWRRMSARQQRSFAAAFTGVFGAPPDDMYGRFYVEVMAKALEARRLLSQPGLVEGELVQKLAGGTGDVAVSPDGKRLALVVRPPGAPSRLVIWNADEAAVDSALLRERRRIQERDPLDVPAIDSFPRPRRALATLRPVAGRSHELPRWMPDGVHLLVSRDEPIGSGATRPDLFLWNSRTGALRRITRGASIRHADPSPDGRSAAAVRCHAGICSLVIVDLASGDWRTLAAGAPDSVWSRPRWSPDGTAIAAGRHAGGAWHVVEVNATSREVRIVTPTDGASRYSPSYSGRGDSLIIVSEAAGVANLELIAAASGRGRTLTRVTGAVLAPEVSRRDRRAYFLSLHTKGYDLRRLPLDSAMTARAPAVLAPSLAPAAPGLPVREATHFLPSAIPAPRDYALGPRRWRVLPGSSYGADGALGIIMVANVDPVGRLNVVAQGGYGERGTWRGGSLAAALRRAPIEFEGSAWHADQRATKGPAAAFAPPSADTRYTALGAAAVRRWEGGRASFVLRAGASMGRLTSDDLEDARRRLAFADARGRLVLSAGASTVGLGLGLEGSTGFTAGERWTRHVASGLVSVGNVAGYLRLDGAYGSATRAADDQPGRRFESFTVGGTAIPYLDRTYLSQRIAAPAVPSGMVSGRRLAMARAAAGRGGLEPYLLLMAAGDSLADWKRIVGLEQELAFPSLGFARLPGVRVRLGAGYSLDEPFRRRAQAYAEVLYRP